MADGDYILESERMRFRLLEDDDFEDLKRLDMDPEVRAFFPEGAMSAEKVREKIARNRASYAAKGFCDFALIDKESGDFVGRAGFGELEDGELEVGYVLLKKYWGRGLAQEALTALLAWARQTLNVPRILAYAPTEHAASLKVMKKCGMRYLKTAQARGVDCTFYEYPFR